MGWTTPLTYEPGNVLSASNLNQQVRDNSLYLFQRPSFSIRYNNGAIYSTTSTSFVAVDTTNLTATLTLAGTKVLIGFNCNLYSDGHDECKWGLDVLVDGTRYASNVPWGTLFGVTGIDEARAYVLGQAPASYTVLVTGLTPGSHTFKAGWRSGGETLKMYAKAGTDPDVEFNLPHFWGVEVG